MIASKAIEGKIVYFCHDSKTSSTRLIVFYPNGLCWHYHQPRILEDFSNRHLQRKLRFQEEWLAPEGFYPYSKKGDSISLTDDLGTYEGFIDGNILQLKYFRQKIPGNILSGTYRAEYTFMACPQNPDNIGFKES